MNNGYVTTKSTVRRGEIYYIIKAETFGSEQETGRPAIVVSNDDNNRNAHTVEVVYLTTQSKNPLPTHVKTYATGRESTVLCEQISTVALERVGKYVATLSPDEMREVEDAMLCSLGIEFTSNNDAVDDAYGAYEEPEPEAPAVSTEAENELNQSLISIKAERDVYKNLYETLLTKITGGKI